MSRVLIDQALPAQTAVRSFDPSVRFGMMEPNPDLLQAESLDQLLEVVVRELRAVVVDNPGLLAGIRLQGGVNHIGHFGGSHARQQIPVHLA